MAEIRSNYVRAVGVTQRTASPTPNDADVYLGGNNQVDGEGRTYVTLEVKPAFGMIASVRLSLDELQTLHDLILDRLGGEAVAVPLPTVQVTIPKGAMCEVTWL